MCFVLLSYQANPKHLVDGALCPLQDELRSAIFIKFIFLNCKRFNSDLEKFELINEFSLFFLVYTLSGNDNHAPCVFPFIFRGMEFTDCTSIASKNNKVWCATTSSYDRDKKWGYCQTDNDVKDCRDLHNRCGEWARDGECVVNPPYMRRKCPRSCGLCTHDGNGRGAACKFPFFYKNRFVYGCVYFNNKTWCATTTNYNKDKRWGYCFPKCEFKLLQQVQYRGGALIQNRDQPGRETEPYSTH